MGERNESRRFALTEDWLATLIGLAIVLIIAMGLLGPGAQTVTIEVAPGESASQQAQGITGWQVSAKLGDVALDFDEAVADLSPGAVISYLCLNGVLDVDPEAGSMSGADTPTDFALLTVQNDCNQNLTITYKTDKVIPWPLLGLFSQ